MLRLLPACPAPTGSSPPPRPATASTAWPPPPPSSASLPVPSKAPRQGPEAAACSGRSRGGPARRGACQTAGARARWMLGRGPVHQRLRASVRIPHRTRRGSSGAGGTRWGLEGLMAVEAAEDSLRWECDLLRSLFLFHFFFSVCQDQSIKCV